MNRRAVFFAICCTALALCSGGSASHAHDQGSVGDHSSGRATHAHGGVTFAELEGTVTALKRARVATEKYQDVRSAEADGYRAYGPYVAGMGFHYVNVREAGSTFDIERPPILLYERDETGREPLRLVGVSYLLAAPAGPDGQPIATPFPRALAAWHRHKDICLYTDRSVRLNMHAAGCQQQGGRFIAETDWMVHAWIWKDSPAGVFSPINPDVD
jgi:hypothetical protein